MDMVQNMSIQENEREIARKPYNRRSRLEIRLDVLRAIKTGVKKPTRIMYASNISWTPVQRILKSLVSNGFVREVELKGDKRTSRCYEITQSGLNVLMYLDRETDFLLLMESANSKVI